MRHPIHSLHLGLIPFPERRHMLLKCEEAIKLAWPEESKQIEMSSDVSMVTRKAQVRPSGERERKFSSNPGCSFEAR